MIRHLLFLHPSGSPLFTRSFEKGIECCTEEHKLHSSVVEKSGLFSSFLTSMNLLAGEFGGKLRHLKIGQWDVFIETNDFITGVVLTTPSDDHSIHDKYSFFLTKLLEEFRKRFQKELSNWDGEVTKFDRFDEHLKSAPILIEQSIETDLCKTCIKSLSDTIENLA